MAKSVKDYWRSIRKIASELDPEAAARDTDELDAENRTHLERSGKEIWLISIANETIGTVAGSIISATPWVAARYLKEQTHVLATPEQVRGYKTELTGRKDQIEREEADRKGVPTTKLLEALVSQTGGRKGSAKE